MKTTAQENGDGCGIRLRCVRDDALYADERKGMLDKRLDHFACVSAAWSFQVARPQRTPLKVAPNWQAVRNALTALPAWD
jgi:hypothetical protein